VEEYGVEVDVKAIEYRLDWALEEQEKLEQRLYRLHGSEINLDSNPQLVQWLYEDLGLTPATYTPTGQPQVNAYNLAANPHPVTRLLRARNKRVDTVKFFNAYLQLRDENNRLHPTINTMQARTHRFSCQDPNAQQIPARGDRFTTREVFVSGDGWFAGADYDKQELRLAAEYAGDGALLAALTSGEDIYVSMASAMLRKPANQISGGER
jgi:DNA polymerase-1